MWVSDVIEFYGGAGRAGSISTPARIAKVSTVAVHKWVNDPRGIVPYHSAKLLYEGSGHGIPLHPHHYDDRGRITVTVAPITGGEARA